MNQVIEKVESLFFEDFTPGRRFAHFRGRTVTEMDNVLLTHLTMNTAQAHFNEESMKDTAFGQRLVFGGITASMVIGLASQDTAEQAIAELRLDRLRLQSPVFHGDTLSAYSEVLSATPAPDRADAGVVRFRHWGMNQREQIVCEAERTVLIKRRTGERHDG
ncbi:maoC like domain protein [Paraburkholderia xenovorans LB400]|uniref:Dehydratase n=1 Tax=Paraburkholderia xenovorans (strain LB400) TaxID=266265 RepID=Q13GS6_PARXL|nr:MaoC family dehydratase [Paraburkholderia xenovorans]ABE36713.1 Putative dehydratase [Paraburkholderia xenovorans LB400]AIP34216.1 maoC like domain protein [Paraburkholderia xenovorans LB400]